MRMLKVRIKGPLKRSLGMDDFEMEGGSLKEVLEGLSKVTGRVFFEKDGKIYMKTNIGGKEVKFTVTLFFNGRNVLSVEKNQFDEGVLEIITPVGGG